MTRAMLMTLVAFLLASGAQSTLRGQAGSVGVQQAPLPAEPRLVGRLPEAAPALSIALRGRLAAIPAHARGVHLVDIADPAGPRLLATASVKGQAYDVALWGERMAVATWKGGLELFDLSDPAAPRAMGQAETKTTARSVAVLADGTVVTGSWSAADFEHGDPNYGLEFWDVSADGPRRMAELKTPGWAGDLAVRGTMVYVADGPGGIRVVDASDPAAPREVGSLATEVRAYGIDAGEDGRLYVADNEGGLFIVDVLNPTMPRILGHLAPGGAAYGVAAAAGGQIWLALALGGDPSAAGRVVLVDAADPRQPRVLAERATDRRAWGVAVDEAGRAYVAATDSGLWVLGPPDRESDRRLWLPWSSGRR